MCILRLICVFYWKASIGRQPYKKAINFVSHIHMGACRGGGARVGICPPPLEIKIYGPPPKDNLMRKKSKKNQGGPYSKQRN